PEQRQQDRAGRDPDRARVRRRLSMGRADGGLAARLAAGCDLLLAVRRLLRVVADRRGEGVAGYLLSSELTGSQPTPGGCLANSLARFRNSADGLSVPATRAKQATVAGNSRLRQCMSPCS